MGFKNIYDYRFDHRVDQHSICWNMFQNDIVSFDHIAYITKWISICLVQPWYLGSIEYSNVTMLSIYFSTYSPTCVIISKLCKNLFSHITSWSVVEQATHSASIVDKATQFCFLLHHDTTLLKYVRISIDFFNFYHLLNLHCVPF